VEAGASSTSSNLLNKPGLLSLCLGLALETSGLGLGLAKKVLFIFIKSTS